MKYIWILALLVVTACNRQSEVKEVNEYGLTFTNPTVHESSYSKSNVFWSETKMNVVLPDTNADVYLLKNMKISSELSTNWISIHAEVIDSVLTNGQMQVTGVLTEFGGIFSNTFLNFEYNSDNKKIELSSVMVKWGLKNVTTNIYMYDIEEYKQYIEPHYKGYKDNSAPSEPDDTIPAPTPVPRRKKLNFNGVTPA